MLTHLRHRAAPLLRFRTHDHVEVRTSPCACGRTGPRVRCLGRTDDMLIVRGVNVFPSAVRDVVGSFARGQWARRAAARLGRRQAGAAAPVSVELARGREPDDALAEAIRERLRSVLVVATRVELVPWGQPRAQRVQVDRPTLRGAECGRSRARASTTSRSSARIAGRRSISGRACSACRSSSSSRTSTTRRRATSTSTRRRPARHGVHERGAHPGRLASLEGPGNVHHLAFALSQATFHRLEAAGRAGDPPLRRQETVCFMDSIYFDDPLGLLIELASYRFEPPFGYTHADVLLEAHKLRVARRLQHRPGPPHRTRSSCSSHARGPRCPRIARPRTSPEGEDQNGHEHAQHPRRASTTSTASSSVRQVSTSTRSTCGARSPRPSSSRRTRPT